MVYSDSDWRQDKLDRESVAGFFFMLSKGAIRGRSQMQDVIAQSTVIVKSISLSFAIQEYLWLKKFNKPLEFLSDTFETAIKDDSQGQISLSKNNIVNDRPKNIEIKYQLIVDNVRCGNVKVKYIYTS